MIGSLTSRADGLQGGVRPATENHGPMVVLGIDPGLANCGFGVVVRRSHRLVATDGGVIATAAGLAPERRLTTLYARLSDLIEEHRPDAVALEALYFGQNVRTAFAVGQARGVVLLAAGQHGIDCIDYTPQQVKGAVCGAGRADKGQVARMVADAAVAAAAAAARPRRRRARRRHLPCQPRAVRGGGRRVIALVAGEVAVRRPDHVVVETAGGVGYRLAVSAETLRQVPGVGRAVSLHTHLVVRDDALALYGFATEEERDLFLALIGVQSVGPKVALAVLSGGTPRELVAALVAGDVARLQAVPGIGKRTAERIVVELREKVGVPNDLGAPITVTRGDDPRHLARDGLLELGFQPAEAQALLEAAEGETAEELLASALRGARQ